MEVATVTLDSLIAAHGVPGFCKIDVEGFELNVLMAFESREAIGVRFA